MSATRQISKGLVFAAAAGLAVAVTGCSSGSSDIREDGRIVIDYWEKWTNFEKEAMQRIDDYNASQDKVWVNFVSQSSLERKLLLATSGGNPPDVSGFWSYALPSFVDMGALQPLDYYMEDAGVDGEDYVPSIYALCHYRDHTWGLPTTPASIALHYNVDMLEEAGLDPAADLATLDRFDAASQALTRSGDDGKYDQMGFLPTDPGWWTPMWGMWFGDPLISADGQELTCDSPESIAALEWFASFTKDYDYEKMRLFESAHRGQFASSSNSFMSNRMAMKLQGVWMASFIETFGPDVKWAAAPFPAGFETGGEPVTIVETDLLVIPRGAEHPREAWDFIQFVQQQRNMERLCLDQFKFSPLREVSEDFYASHPNKEIELFRELAESKNAFGAPQIAIWTEYRDELGAAYQQLWTNPGGSDPETLMRQVKERLQPRLDQANRAWERVREDRLAAWSARP
ncbi:MAG: ABC transporter substrate-binding protein [Sumerlaeia bacterium]